MKVDESFSQDVYSRCNTSSSYSLESVWIYLELIYIFSKNKKYLYQKIKNYNNRSIPSIYTTIRSNSLIRSILYFIFIIQLWDFVDICFYIGTFKRLFPNDQCKKNIN